MLNLAHSLNVAIIYICLVNKLIITNLTLSFLSLFILLNVNLRSLIYFIYLFMLAYLLNGLLC